MSKTIPRWVVIPFLWWEFIVDKIEWHDGLGDELFFKVQRRR